MTVTTPRVASPFFPPPPRPAMKKTLLAVALARVFSPARPSYPTNMQLLIDHMRRPARRAWDWNQAPAQAVSAATTTIAQAVADARDAIEASALQ